MSNQLNYVQYDFADLVIQLQNLLKSKDSWSDLYRSSTGQALIEFYAYIANMILYYVERTAEEMYIQTAQRKSSVINLSSLLNYIPARNVSATGNAVFTLATVKAKNVYISAKTGLQTTTGYKYSIAQDVVIFPGQLTVTASVIQGLWVDESFISSGEVNQEYFINDTQVENSNIKVFVDGIEWTKVTSFVNSNNTSKHFILTQNLDDTITIKFGDNIFGVSPTVGSTVNISYIKSDGVSGNVYSSGVLNIINDPIYDADGLTITDISVTNSSAILGGDDAETIEDIRYNAPRVFSTGDRFVTKEDGIAIISDYPSVASVNVWGENEETPPNISMYNQAKISCILQDWTLPNTDFKTALSTFLYTKAPLTIRFSYSDPTLIYAFPIVTAYVKAGYSLSGLENSVETELQNQFLLGSTSKIGTDIRHAPVLKAIQVLDGVSYCYVALQLYKVLTLHYNSSTDYGTLLDALTVKASTVKIYIGDSLVATDDGSGTLIDLLTGYTVSGTVNYTTGEVKVNFNPDLPIADVVSVRYEQNESGDIVVGKNQIAKYFDSTITVSYE